jgi:hypothetical protein
MDLKSRDLVSAGWTLKRAHVKSSAQLAMMKSPTRVMRKLETPRQSSLSLKWASARTPHSHQVKLISVIQNARMERLGNQGARARRIRFRRVALNSVKMGMLIKEENA